MSLIHRATTALLTTALAVTLVGAGVPAEAAHKPSPADLGGDWLSSQLTHGLVHNGQFDVDDYGLTIDTAFALEQIGGHGPAIIRIRKALAKHAADYTAGTAATDDPGARYAGATAKLLDAAEDMGARGRHFGGLNLVKRLVERISTSAPTVGRIEDKSGFGDFANTVGQIFAVRGLLRIHSPRAEQALHFLLQQQCPGGGFRVSFTTDTGAAAQGCTSKGDVDSDTTALAVVQLWRFAHHSHALMSALTGGLVWLFHHQHQNGSLGGGSTTPGSNTNSTGLAGWAFGVGGMCKQTRSAASWIGRLQVQSHVAGTPLAGERGAIAYDQAALKTAKKDGITKATRDQWRRAATQAAPALTFPYKVCG
jgi:hypothetical protein